MKRFIAIFLIGLGGLVAEAQDAKSFSASLNLCSPQDAIFMVETDVDQGVAFLMQDQTGTVWMVSSSSVFQGAEKYNIVNAAGVQVALPDQIFVAAHSDMLMFRTDELHGLLCAESCGFEEEIWAYRKDWSSDSDGTVQLLNREKKNLRKLKVDLDASSDDKESAKERLAEIDVELKEYVEKLHEQRDSSEKLGLGYLLPGQTLALGPDRIEISALINRAGCGGPVLNKDHEVIGVASHLIDNTGLPEWVTKGTQFEETRRFALKLDAIEWLPFETKQFRKEADFIYDNIDSLVDFVQIVERLEGNYLVKLYFHTDIRDIERWIEGHNKVVNKYIKARNERYRNQGEVNRAIRKVERLVDKDIESLVRMIRELEQEAGKGHRVSVPFYKGKLAGLEGFFKTVRERLKENLDSEKS